MKVFKNKLTIDFMGKRRIVITASAIVVICSFVLIFAKGFNYGIDFTGGTQIIVHFDKKTGAGTVRSELAKLKYKDAVVQEIGDAGSNEFIIKVFGAGTAVESVGEKIIKDLNKAIGKAVLKSEDSVGPKIGSDLRQKAIYTILFSLLGMLIYVWIRFDFKFGVGSIVALIHDVAISIGALIATGREMDLTTIAALLTVVGYSMNDTVIVFDRIREEAAKRSKDSLESIMNSAINLTLSRTILTSVTVFIVVASLFFLGGPVINTFAFTLLVGVLVGTYSSIYIASPVALAWENSIRKRRANNIKSSSQPARKASLPQSPAAAISGEAGSPAVAGARKGKTRKSKKR